MGVKKKCILGSVMSDFQSRNLFNTSAKKHSSFPLSVESSSRTGSDLSLRLIPVLLSLLIVMLNKLDDATSRLPLTAKE